MTKRPEYPRVLRFPESTTRMISEGLRTMPLLDSPYDFPHRMGKHDTKLKLCTIQKGRKHYYDGKPMPDWDGTEIDPEAA